MKKVLKPASKEDCVYYSDVSGKIFDHNVIPFVFQICCNYGSTLDGNYGELHLTNEEGLELLKLLKQKLSKDSLTNNKHIFDHLDELS